MGRCNANVARLGRRLHHQRKQPQRLHHRQHARALEPNWFGEHPRHLGAERKNPGGAGQAVNTSQHDGDRALSFATCHPPADQGPARRGCRGPSAGRRVGSRVVDSTSRRDGIATLAPLLRPMKLLCRTAVSGFGALASVYDDKGAERALPNMRYGHFNRGLRNDE